MPASRIHEGTRPVAFDLYAGAGGLSLGMEQAGFDVVAAAEFDPIHALTHRYNFPATPVLCSDLGVGQPQDVADRLLRLAFGSRGKPPTELDALVGGPPCQGFSVGGVRDATDERNHQFHRFIDLVVSLRPKVFCLENVGGLLEPRFDSLRQGAMAKLGRAGYEVTGHDRAVNAADFGVPQSRRRVLILGSRIGSAPSLFSDASESARTTVGQALAGLPSPANYRQLLSTDSVTLTDDDLARLYSPSSAYARRLVGADDDPLDRSQLRSRDLTVLTNSLRTVHTAKSRQRFSRTEPGKVEKVSRLFRLDPDGLARTLRAGTGTDRGSHTSPRPIHPDKPRVITVREAARLHGYPDWFRFHATNWHGHRQVGNSVPPPLAAAAGRTLIAALGIQTPTRATPSIPSGDAAWLWQNRTEAMATLEALGNADGPSHEE